MRHLKRFNEDNSYSKTKKVSFDELSDRAKENARWEVEQGNKVKKYQASKSNLDAFKKYQKFGKDLTLLNSLFYTNGVWAEFKKDYDRDSCMVTVDIALDTKQYLGTISGGSEPYDEDVAKEQFEKELRELLDKPEEGYLIKNINISQ